MSSVQQTFTDALAALVEQLRKDRSILAAILCGSLSHDTVWAKSDIDLVLVTIDDKSVPAADVSLYADGVNVHAMLMPRTQFRQTVEGTRHNSFAHSLLAKGRLLYTHDDTIARLFAGLTDIGTRDTRLRLLGAASAALACLYKARKWLVTRGDLDYTALWILYAATPLATIEVVSARMLAGREVIPQALDLNRTFFSTIYVDLLNAPKTRDRVEAALEAAEAYVAARIPQLFGAVFEYLQDAGEARSATEIRTHFERNLGVECVVTACEYLADQGLIAKVSTPVRVTRKSNVEVQELAFFSLDEPR